jgi:hypothetical protein
MLLKTGNVRVRILHRHTFNITDKWRILQMKLSKHTGWLAAGVISTALFLMTVQGCNNSTPATNSQTLAFSTEYQAIFLSSSQVFFGKAEIGAEYITLKDVYYIQSQVNNETQEVKSTLIKRGNEWHKPDVMYIAKSQVILIEPVAADSQLATLIKETTSQKAATTTAPETEKTAEPAAEKTPDQKTGK